jgi:hypothetical protein
MNDQVQHDLSVVMETNFGENPEGRFRECAYQNKLKLNNKLMKTNKTLLNEPSRTKFWLSLFLQAHFA